MSVEKAAADMKYLLDRGFNRTTVLNLVVNRYHLDKGRRNYLQRYVYPEEDIRNHKSKIIPVEKIRGKQLVIDGFNVLITTESVLTGRELVEGMDGILRDSSGIFSNYKFSLDSRMAVDSILNLLLRHKPKSVLFIFDSQISRSGELSSHVKSRMEELSLNGDSRTSKSADKEIAGLNQITASSDSVIIEKVKSVVDLPALINKRVK